MICVAALQHAMGHEVRELQLGLWLLSLHSLEAYQIHPGKDKHIAHAHTYARTHAGDTYMHCSELVEVHSRRLFQC
jgi:hypothetical protein